MIGIIISENDDNCGPPLRQRKIEKKNCEEEMIWFVILQYII